MASGKARHDNSAGGVVARPAGGEYQVVLIRNGERWSLPKGRIEPGESPDQAAAREIAEECGLSRAELHPVAGLPGSDYVYQHEGVLIFKHVEYFLYEAPPDAKLEPQLSEIDAAEWFSIEDAIIRATFKDAKTALEKSKELLARPQ